MLKSVTPRLHSQLRVKLNSLLDRNVSRFPLCADANFPSKLISYFVLASGLPYSIGGIKKQSNIGYNSIIYDRVQ